MWYFQSSCRELFVCTAILCWDSNFLHYYFYNITNCTPSPLHFQPIVRFIPNNKNYSRIQQKYSTHGFICSNCTREKTLIEYNFNTGTQCHKQTTMIELRKYCQYEFRSKQMKISSCQCFPTDRPIQPIKDWVKALVKHGKSHMNIVRVNNINRSAGSSVYFLFGSIILLVVFGGIIGMIFYAIKVKSIQLQTFK